MRIEGHLTLPGRSRRARVWLECADGRFHLRDEEGTSTAAGRLAQLRFEPPVGQAPRRVILPDGALFETTEHAAVDAVNPNPRALGLHRAEAFRPRLFAIVALTVLAGWLIWRYALGALVAVAVWMTPPQFAQVIDAQTLATLDRLLFTPSELPEEERAVLRADFDRLAAALAPREAHTPLRLEFRSGPIGPNAFALPGGTVVLTDALIALAEDPDMIAGVMAHEIGHVVHRHSLQQIYRALGLAVLVSFLAGDTGPVIEAILLEGNLMAQLAYSRAHEFEADAFAVTLSHRAGFDPEGLVRFFGHLVELGLVDPLPSWGSTHPSHEARVEAIRARIAQLPAQLPAR